MSARNEEERQLASVERALQRLAAQRDQLKAEIAGRDESDLRRQHCVKVVCLTCCGTGQVTCGGADLISDPPYQENCDECNGAGYRWAVKWSSKTPVRTQILLLAEV